MSYLINVSPRVTGLNFITYNKVTVSLQRKEGMGRRRGGVGVSSLYNIRFLTTVPRRQSPYTLLSRSFDINLIYTEKFI